MYNIVIFKVYCNWFFFQIIGCSQFHQYFLIDTLGWPLVNFNPSLTDSWEIPKYPCHLTYFSDYRQKLFFLKKRNIIVIISRCWRIFKSIRLLPILMGIIFIFNTASCDLGGFRLNSCIDMTNSGDCFKIINSIVQ